MPLTSAQKTAIKADILANPTLSSQPNTSDGAFFIAAYYNEQASPNFTVWRTEVPIVEITDAIVWANMTPSAAPDGTQLWANRALQCQGKQFNLQNLILGRESVDSSRQKIRDAFQDCLTALPSGAAGANQGAGWAAVETSFKRLANRIEALLAVGTGSVASPAKMTFEGEVDYEEIDQARNS